MNTWTSRRITVVLCAVLVLPGPVAVAGGQRMGLSSRREDEDDDEGLFGDEDLEAEDGFWRVEPDGGVWSRGFPTDADMLPFRQESLAALLDVRRSAFDARDMTRDEVIETIVQLISEAVDPTSWCSSGGEVGTMRELAGLLVVAQTAENHEAIAALLNSIRDRLRKGGETTDGTPAAFGMELPERIFNPDGHITEWVEELLAKARAGKLSRFSSGKLSKVGRRQFARIGGIWFDTSLTQLCVIHPVARNTVARAALIKADAELKACFALGRCVVVRVDARSAVCLDELGITKIDDGELKKILAALKKSGS